MRHLILSDIHANLTALDSALAAAKGQWDKAVCLGDVVGYGPDPNEVIDRIRELDAITIRGNHDKAGAASRMPRISIRSPAMQRSGRATSFVPNSANISKNCQPVPQR